MPLAINAFLMRQMIDMFDIVHGHEMGAIRLGLLAKQLCFNLSQQIDNGSKERITDQLQ